MGVARASCTICRALQVPGCLRPGKEQVPDSQPSLTPDPWGAEGTPNTRGPSLILSGSSPCRPNVALEAASFARHSLLQTLYQV